MQAQNSGEIIYSVFYAPGNVDFNAKDKKELRRLAQICQSDSFRYLKVFGFSDPSGPGWLKDSLSSRRAMQVFGFLNASATIDPKLEYVAWLGDSEDVYDLHFPQAHARQRCVDVWIMYKRK